MFYTELLTSMFRAACEKAPDLSGEHKRILGPLVRASPCPGDRPEANSLFLIA